MEEIRPSDITSAVTKVGTSFNPKVFLELMEKFESKISLLTAESKRINVENAATEAESLELAVTAKTLNGVIDKARLGAKRPYLDFGKELDSYVRPSQKSLTNIENAERKKMTEYRNRLLEVKRAAEAREAQKAAEAAKAEVSEEEHALSRLKAPTGQPAMATPAKTVESFAGGSGSYDIEHVPYLDDISKVPAEYLLVDWKKVKAAIKGGIRAIPGIDIKEENKITLRRG